MLSPLLELYFAKSNAVSPLCGETGSGEGCWAMRGGAVTTQAPLTPAPPTLCSYPYPPTHPPAPHTMDHLPSALHHGAPCPSGSCRPPP